MKATLTVLGSGTSMGVPTLGCDCAVCHSTDPHDRRTRPSIMIEYGGKVVLISDARGLKEAGDRVWQPIEVPQVDSLLAPLIYALPVQLLAYHTAVAKGTDVDQPRNLAKSVTVE